ncbi:uncharacterized protein [Epargyreus clarus]|uniref:uncharacterized protein n=1 Tax=Epargyreus clarus TaxID=520877 RepID=UPI003C2B691A
MSLEKNTFFSDTETDKDKSPPSYVQRRKKRPICNDDDVIGELRDFKKEIKRMISNWIASSEQERSLLKKDITDIKQSIQEVKSTNTQIEKSVDVLSTQFNAIVEKVAVLENKCVNNLTYIKQLEDNIEYLQRNSHKTTVELRNIPKAKEKELTSDLVSVVLNAGKVLDVEIKPSDIRDVYRRPNKSGLNGAIIAEFTSVSLKSNLLHSTKAYNAKRTISDKLSTASIGIAGERVPIYVSEYLTNKGRRIFFLARQFAKEHKFKFCWSAGGRIFLRKDENSKQVLVESENFLTELNKQY